MEELAYTQLSFAGGMSQKIDSTRLERNKYPLLINGRNRFDRITPIKLPALVEQGLPTDYSIIQGVYGAGNFLLAFIDGQCWVKDYNLMATAFVQIANFQMNAAVETYFVEVVPASTINFKRVPVDPDNKQTDVELTSTIQGTSAAVVVQDGISQPWIIFSDGTARVTQNYNQWSNEGVREYVPIGKEMIFQDGILYVMSPSGRERYHSVTGRPLDFMVNIGAGGDKLPLEADGGASSVSDSVDFDITTCLGKLNTPDGSIYQGTIRNSYNVIPLTQPEELIFGEPNFRHGYLFSAGPKNQFSFIELLGDYAFIDLNGLRSFNAISQYQVEGNNSPFSNELGDIIQGINQDFCAAISFDNYAMFACKTKHGYAIIVYDTLSETFVGLDIYPNLTGAIKQFTQIKTNNSRMLFFITSDNKIYEAFQGPTATCQIYIGEFCTNTPGVEQKPQMVRCIFSESQEAGQVLANLYVDRKLSQQNLTFPLAVVIEPFTIPVALPFGVSTADTIVDVPFNFGRGKQGWKIGVFLQWSVQADLTHVYVGANKVEEVGTEKAKNYVRTKELLNGLQ